MVSLAALVLVGLISNGFAMPSTVPAFLWSPHHDLQVLISSVSDNGLNEAVNYQIISPKDLAKSISSQAGWSNLLLQSSDLTMNKNADSTLLELLKNSFTRSNFSMAFPYISASEEEKLETLLVSGLAEACGDDLGIGNVAFIGSCSMEDANDKKIVSFHSVKVISQMMRQDLFKMNFLVLLLCLHLIILWDLWSAPSEYPYAGDKSSANKDKWKFKGSCLFVVNKDYPLSILSLPIGVDFCFFY